MALSILVQTKKQALMASSTNLFEENKKMGVAEDQVISTKGGVSNKSFTVLDTTISPPPPQKKKKTPMNFFAGVCLI